MGSLDIRRSRAPSRHGLVAAGFIACAMVLGGGGSPNPASEMVLQLVFATALMLWLWWAPRGGREVRRLPRSLLIFGLVLVIIPLSQLVPLPPPVWQALPARALAVASLEQIGAEGRWFPFSISPALTLAGLLALIPAVGTMWAAAMLRHTDRGFVIRTVAVLALAGAFLGTLQMAGAPDAFRMYATGHRGWLTAFHANRNAAADVLLIGSLALSAWYASAGRRPETRRRILPFFAAGQLVLLAAVVMTGSRAGIALLAMSVPLQALILLEQADGMRFRNWFAASASAVVVLALAPLAISGNSRLARVAERFDAAGDARLALWQDTLRAIDGFWPAGSGLGTFPLAFQPFESQELLEAGFTNRAHSEYLEILLELGVLAVPLLAGGLVFLIMITRRALRQLQLDRSAQIFALGTLGIVALHSIVDYPLRNMAIACLAGFATGLLASVPGSARRSGREGLDGTE